MSRPTPIESRLIFWVQHPALGGTQTAIVSAGANRGIALEVQHYAKRVSVDLTAEDWEHVLVAVRALKAIRRQDEGTP
jgi:hypothetical protein